VAATVLTILVVEVVVCAVAMLPVVGAWTWLLAAPVTGPLRMVTLAAAVVPSYVAFALALLVVTPIANRVTRAYTPAGADLRIADFEWELLRWARYLVAGHVARTFAGVLFRGSPVWTFYLRLDGARIGHRVFVNTISISDHNLLEFGHDVVIGADVHLSGHTVEGGRLKTAPVRLGHDVTIGLGTNVGIGVMVGDGCQIGALSLVPKHAILERETVYVGVPVHRLTPRAAPRSDRDAWRAAPAARR
jgi:acetyltransferase-like isoleucine patch superfamily enzyme